MDVTGGDRGDGAEDPQTDGPRLAVLFWFYHEPEICAARLRHLRALNPDTPIYGLFGGSLSDAAAIAAQLGTLLDDLYVYGEERDPVWKHRHGDQLIAAWHRDRGRQLVWDTLVVVQWDMLVLRPLAELFGSLRTGEALFSGFRPAAEVADWWGWLNPRNPERVVDRDAFQNYLRDRQGYEGPLWCCLFIVVCLPRIFLDRYVEAGHPEIGFLEYKIPTLARAFGIPIREDHPFKPWWAADPQTKGAPDSDRLLNAVGADVPREIIEAEGAAGRGAIIHPFRQHFPSVPARTLLEGVFRCRVCDGPAETRHAAREMMFGRRDPFTYRECSACGCLQIETVPENLADYYGEDYYSFGDLDAEFADPALRGAYGERVRALLTLPEAEALAVSHADMRRPLLSLRRLDLARRPRILDVGCGSGRLLYQLRLAGWDAVEGVDPFLPQDVVYANGLEVRRAEIGAAAGPYDVIMLHHVFEHLPDPLATLRAVRGRLAPGGLCLLRLPLADSEACETYGVDWVQLDAPRHLFLHTKASLERLAERSGFRIAEVAYDSYDLQFWGSEQYRRDIPLFDPGSYRWGQGAPLFTPEEIDRWRARSVALNAEGRGDQAAFYLEPV
ncbi:class I SAM-dependent methyltransferase [Methylobacterium hispanicum]|uniref:class I SAM-dependent methyltransferase n=1 Tax=Methylobacterium hispanicum TaxID=270350 RepID=UPI002F33741F